MSVTTDVTTTVKGLTASLEEVRKPAFAVAGLADLALEQVKQAPAAYVAEVRRAQERLAEVPAVVRTWPSRVQELRGEVETRVSRAGEQYSALVVRGERLLTAVRRRPATEVAVTEAQETVTRSEQAGRAAGTSARAGVQTVQDAAEELG